MARRRYQKGRVHLCGEMWYGRYREDVMRDGHTVRVRRNTPLGTKKEYPTKRLAERRMEQVLGRINAADYRPGRVATVADFAERWKVEIVSKKKPSSQGPVKSHLRRHILPYLGKLRLDSLGVETQQSFVTNLTKTLPSTGSVVSVLSTLASMISTAKKWGYLRTSEIREPCFAATRPAVRAHVYGRTAAADHCRRGESVQADVRNRSLLRTSR